MFDLPSVTSEDRREYCHFRKSLMSNGFLQLQESCYLKMIRNVATMDLTIQSLNAIMPKTGDVSVLPLTVDDFREMKCLLGKPFPIHLFTDDVLFIGEPEGEECA